MGILILGWGWLGYVTLRRQELRDPLVASVDVAGGLVILILCALAIPPGRRLTSLNWANAAAIMGVVPVAAVTYRRTATSFAAAAALAATCLILARLGLAQATVKPNLTDMVSTGMYFFAPFVAARPIQAKLRQWAGEQDELDRQRRDAERALAIEHERNRQNRLLHDTVLQTILDHFTTG